MEKTLITLSGGGTKFIALAGAMEVLSKHNVECDYMAGISAGAVLTLPFVLGRLNDTIDIGLNLKLDDFFDKLPITEKNRVPLCAIIRFLRHGYLGVQNVPKLLSKYISEHDFKYYQESKFLPEVFIVAVSTVDGFPKVWNLKDKTINYEKYLKIVAASCAIPAMTQPILIDGVYYYDGGVRNHNPSAVLINHNINFNKLISIYTRNEKAENTIKNWSPTPKRVISRILDFYLMDVTEGDEEVEKLYCQKHEKKLIQIFLPRVPSKGGNSFYSTDKETLQELYNEAKRATESKIKLING